MFIWSIIQFCIIVIIAILGITQLVLPPIIGMKFFWLFRKDDPEKELKEAYEDLSDTITRNKVGEIREKIKDLTDDKE